jgi:hypothetical protein
MLHLYFKHWDTSNAKINSKKLSTSIFLNPEGAARLPMC